MWLGVGGNSRIGGAIGAEGAGGAGGYVVGTVPDGTVGADGIGAWVGNNCGGGPCG